MSVFDEPGPNGYVAVYLPSGTQLTVQGNELLRLESNVPDVAP